MRTSTLAIEGEGLKVQEFGIPSSHSRLFLCYSNPPFQLSKFHVGAKLGQPEGISHRQLIYGDDEALACLRRLVMLLSAKQDPEKRVQVMGGVPGRGGAPCKDCVPDGVWGALSVLIKLISC